MFVIIRGCWRYRGGTITMLNNLNDYQFIDLTHTLNPHVPTWNGSCGFEQSIKMDYEQGCRVQAVKMHAGVGTHMDAPSHFIPGGKSISDIPIENLIVPACVIDVSMQASENYMVSEKDLSSYEKTFTKIPKNSLVIFYTGWSKHWHEPSKYRNPDQNGVVRFPGVSAKVAEILMEREIAGIGIDTLSPDGSDMSFPVHHIILGAGRYIIENLCHCEKLPPQGSYVIALPLKVQEGTESAMRVVGIKSK